MILAHGIVDENDLAKVEAKVRESQARSVAPVLTHYDNRLDNLVINGDRIMMLDWGLSLAGNGISQELIKLFETEPASLSSPRVSAFLHGYGLTHDESLDAVEDGRLMLLLDGIAMSHGWADDPDMLGGVRAWMQTVKRTCDTW